MSAKSLRIGSRGSRLALRQSELVAELLQHAHQDLEVELVIVQSTGDRVLDSPLWQIGGKGLFTKEVEAALADDRIDLAVHSLKDLPTDPAPGLDVAAILPRESPWDMLLAAEEVDLASLPEGTVIGTSSLRRRAELLHHHPHLRIENLRGNVPTRIAKMLRGEYRAIILAEAGLSRLGESAPWQRRLRPAEMLPAPGQGALALQIRADDKRARGLLRALHDDSTAACVHAERALLHHLGGGCQAPLGALATIRDGELHLRGRVLSLDCKSALEDSATGPVDDPDALGCLVAEALAKAGADKWMADWRVAPTNDEAARAIAEVEAGLEGKPLRNLNVVVTRDEDADGPLSRLLRERGAVPLSLPLVRSTLLPESGTMQRAIGALPEYGWVVLTSARAAEALQAAGLTREAARAASVRWACVGDGTARRLESLGATADLVAARETAEALAEELLPRLQEEAEERRRVLFPRSSMAAPTLTEKLRAAGIQVDDPVAYETELLPTHHATVASLLGRGEVRCLLFCSPSAVASFASAWKILTPEDHDRLAPELILGSIGPSTSAALRELGLSPAAEASPHTYAALVTALEQRFTQ